MDKPTTENKTVRLTLRLSETDYAKLLGASVGMQRTVSDAARLLMLRALEPQPMFESSRTVDQSELNRVIQDKLGPVPPHLRQSVEPRFKQAHKAAAKVLSTD